MSSVWCTVCCSRHAVDARCPGELRATGTERHGWRVNVLTPRGIEAWGVLIAPAGDLWRARILTFPNVLWLVPGGRGTLKFAGHSPQDAERQAIEFIRQHCQERGYTIRHRVPQVETAAFDRERDAAARSASGGEPADRKIRFLKIRFGFGGVTDTAGTGNLSETGMFIITGTPAERGQWLNMLLDLGDADLPLRGKVCWARREHVAGRAPGMGVHLQDPPRSYVEYVRSLP